MKKIYLNIILLIALIGQISAQNHNDFFNINNYKSDVVITFNAASQSSNILSDYGAIRSMLGGSMNHYIFQGQEYDVDLKLYFFPSRIYSATEKKFYQPDPKSQYFSPYLFVGADPVNIVDTDGNEGKSLVLRGIDNGESIETSMIRDDFYDFTLNDFMESNIPDIPEWNGNIYVVGHMSGEGEIEVERLDGLKSKKLISENLDSEEGFMKQFHQIKDPHAFGMQNASNRTILKMDADVFGERVNEFAMVRDVEVKNVVFAGCEGSAAAEKSAEGFKAVAGYNSEKGATANFFGTKKGFLCAEVEVGDISSWSWIPKGAKISEEADVFSKIGDQPIKTHSFQRPDSPDLEPAMGDFSDPVPMDLLNHGRISPSAENFVDKFHVSY